MIENKRWGCTYLDTEFLPLVLIEHQHLYPLFSFVCFFSNLKSDFRIWHSETYTFLSEICTLPKDMH